jgi:two-component system sensor histidine kinase MprB
MHRLAELKRIHLLRGIRGRTQAGGVEVASDIRPATIAGNRPALHRLFLVLLDNALKYSDAGTDVNVAVNVVANPTIGEEGSRVTVSIENFGPGISETDLPHIFKRFYRADRVRGGEGYGLGLSLAHSIARAHRATIEARSAGGSTIFEVTFPLREGALTRI